MSVIRLQRRGILTLPSKIRRQLALRDGQPLGVRVLDPRHIVLEILPALSPDDLFATFPIADPIADDWRDEMAATMALHHAAEKGPDD
jgi:bifunctional DNA-binding transcriptional regulator/antitoxin component of YhaV-PrlF toxin-antitoxin module